MIKFRIQAVFYFLKNELKNAHFLTLIGKNSTLIKKIIPLKILKFFNLV